MTGRVDRATQFKLFSDRDLQRMEARWHQTGLPPWTQTLDDEHRVAATLFELARQVRGSK